MVDLPDPQAVLESLARTGPHVGRSGLELGPDQCAAAAALARYFTNAVAAWSVLPFDSTAAS